MATVKARHANLFNPVPTNNQQRQMPSWSPIRIYMAVVMLSVLLQYMVSAALRYFAATLIVLLSEGRERYKYTTVRNFDNR